MDLRALADESYVSLTTFRRSGDPIATPVWVIADPADEHGLVVMTIDGSAKVRRLRNDPRATLQACGRFGLAHEGAPVLSGQVRIGEFDEQLQRAFKAKYGAEYRMMTLRKRDRVALHIS